MQTLSDIFVATAHRYPERPALWVDGCATAYEELCDEAGKLAAAISAIPWPPRDAVMGRQCGLLVGRSRTGYAAVLGALFAGCAYVPLNPRFPSDRLQAILDASDVDVVIVDGHSIAAAEALIPARSRPLAVLLPDTSYPPRWLIEAGHHRIVCRPEIEGCTSAPLPAGRREDDGAYLLFTSGSTGAPKGVLIRHRNVTAYLRSVLPRYEPRPEDRFTQLFDFSFDLSAHDMFVCWSCGACLYCPPAGALMSPRDFVRKHALTFWFSVPSTAATMARMRMLAPASLSSLRVSLFCGEALPTGLAEMWQCAAPNSIIENLYGPTEATIAITAYRVPGDRAIAGRHGIVPIGLPFPDQHAVIIEARGKPVPDGQPGELCLGGSQVASGYWRLPELTAERFAAPLASPETGEWWYRTGDRVIKDPEYGLLFLGRLDRQVKIRGYRVDLEEIETVVREASGGDSIAALPWPPDAAELARYIVVFVAGEENSKAAIMEHCRKRLPPVLVPREIHFLADWPLNGNGKTDFAVLKRALGDGHAACGGG